MVQQLETSAESLNFWLRSKRCREEILNLHETASQLELHGDTAQFHDAQLQDCITAVDTAEQKALYCREHLRQHILSLTMLSDLVQEDRVARIIAIDEMEKMLQVNDSTRATLAGLHKQLQVKLTEALLSKENAAEVAQQTSGIGPCRNDLVLPEESEHMSSSIHYDCSCLCVQCGNIDGEGHIGYDEFAGHLNWFCTACWQEWDTCDESDESSSGCDESSLLEESDIPGSTDRPGFVEVPHMSTLLYVGNQYSAASESFDEVISTCMPLDLDGRPAEHLSTKAVPFDDWEGFESEEAAAIAAKSIVAGANALNEALEGGKRTLVHCESGQNASGAICCAYAILFKQWTAEEAIEYFRCCSLRDRCYFDQRPMNNGVLNGIIERLEC